MPANPSLPELPESLPQPAPAPTNRAARRGKRAKHVPDQAGYQPLVGHARPAQGRRINPVRRTG